VNTFGMLVCFVLIALAGYFFYRWKKAEIREASALRIAESREQTVRNIAGNITGGFRTQAEALGHTIRLYEDMISREPQLAETLSIGHLELLKGQKSLLEAADKLDEFAANPPQITDV
jgi:hypothetical protein